MELKTELLMTNLHDKINHIYLKLTAQFELGKSVSGRATNPLQALIHFNFALPEVNQRRLGQLLNFSSPGNVQDRGACQKFH